MQHPVKASAQVPRDPRARHIWISAALRLKGSSFAQIARDLDITPQAVQQATRVSNRRAQEAMAAKLDMAPQTLFPEWYHPDGTRIGDPLCCDDNTGDNRPDNANSGTAVRT